MSNGISQGSQQVCTDKSTGPTATEVLETIESIPFSWSMDCNMYLKTRFA